MCGMARSPEGWGEVGQATHGGGVRAERSGDGQSTQAIRRTGFHSGKTEGHRRAVHRGVRPPDFFSDDHSGC